MEISVKELNQKAEKLSKMAVAADGLAKQSPKLNSYIDAMKKDGSVNMESIDSILEWFADNFIGLSLNTVGGRIVIKSLVRFGGSEGDQPDEGVISL